MRSKARGFTIVEIAVVIAVISVLLTLTLVVYNRIQVSARDDRRTADINAIKRSIVNYYNDNGEYPSCAAAGTECSLAYITPNLQKYMNPVPTLDPSGSNYIYISNPSMNQYALFLDYENSAKCKTGTNMNSSWWGSASDCDTSYPNRF